MSYRDVVAIIGHEGTETASTIPPSETDRTNGTVYRFL
jgi:hypothetical protein